MGSLSQKILSYLKSNPVEIFVPYTPTEGIDSLGCVICLEEFTKEAVADLRALFKEANMRTWVVKRLFDGKDQECLVVHLPLRRKSARISYHGFYEPAEVFAEWLLHSLEEKLKISATVRITRTEDVRGSLA